MKKMKKQVQRILASLLCASMVLGSCTVSMAAPESDAKAELVNLALNKPVTASAEYSTMPAEKAVDGIVNNVKTDRWSAEKGPEQWITVDLGAESEIHEFRIVAENDQNEKVGKFLIEGSHDGKSFETIYQSEDQSADGFAQDYVFALESPETYRYVKLTIQKLKQGSWENVSLREFEVRGVELENNLALKKSVTASTEYPGMEAVKAVDGIVNDERNDRWSTEKAPEQWLCVDLGQKEQFEQFRVVAENDGAQRVGKFLIEGSHDGKSFETIYQSDDQSTEGFPQDTVVTLGTPAVYRYVRITIQKLKSGAYNSVSLREFEVRRTAEKEPEAPKVTIDEVLSQIKVTQPTAETEKLQVSLPTVEGFTVKYNGTDYEQVIGEDLTIYKPVVATTVKASFKVTEDETGKYKFGEVNVNVPGTYTAEPGDNAAPSVLPELREWKGTEGTFKPLKHKVYVADAELKPMAEKFAEDYEDITGTKLTVADNAEDADFVFALTEDTSKGLQEEGYLMTIEAQQVSVEAETATGAYWATRTILQSLKQTGSIPCGITRDYPLYKVRGFILDVGRKTFTLDYLQQFVKEMAWYKMNDFHVHLNDNLIPLEDYSKQNKDPMQAYSAFRLESNVKEGGNDGKNKQDLTSKDLFYTKDEFRNFIKEARVQGVNIVPEIDAPAHSLALIKVRPDLRHGLYGRDNDHLALRDKYDDCASFVKGIFDEYMKEEDPVFDELTTVHVGADEYNADKEAYRKFADDMLGYVQETGRTARIWGSLSQCTGTTPVRSKGVQMNLWNFGYANMDKMYEQGYDLINCNDAHYYVVPAAGYYYDYLNAGTMYDLAINSISGVTIPAGDPQMLGGSYAVWNDMTDYLDNGMSEYDIYDRSVQHIDLFAAKLWGKGTKTLNQAADLGDKLGDAPNTNFKYQTEAKDGVILHETFDTVENPVNAAAASVDGKQVLELKGGKSYVETGLETVGLGNDLRVKVKRTSNDATEQILFESPYGSIKAVQKGTGNVGFSRENHDYSFAYTLPVDEWVELEFKNVKDIAELYVNGQKVDVLGDNDKTSNEMADLTGNYKQLHATTMFPIGKIGSETKAFKGYVDDVRVGVNAAYASTMSLDYAMILANEIAKDDAEVKVLIGQAKAVLAEFAPSADEIKELTDSISGALENIETEKADYSRVDKYLALVPDEDMLKMYTPETVAKLQTVMAGIRRDLPKSMQSTVDGYEELLADALNGLTLKKEADVTYVDSNDFAKVTASTFNSASEKPEHVIDNDPNTIWHTNWGITSGDHWITLEMKEAKAVNGLTYVPRSGGGNGTLRNYKIQTSENGTTFTDIKNGTVAVNGDTKVIMFDAPVTTKYIRLVYVGGGSGGFASAAEIKLHRADAKADVAGLKAAIAAAKNVQPKEEYTEKSWKALQDKIQAAEALANSENPKANDVEVMKRELSEAVTNLVLVKDGIYTVKVNGQIIRRAAYNTKVTITAPEPAYGMKFEGWKIEGNDAVICTDETYSFFISNDMSFTASYVAKAEVIEEVTEALITNVIVTPNADAPTAKKDIKFVAQLVVPKGKTLSEAGLVWSNKGKNTEQDLTLENAEAKVDGVKVTKISKISTTYQYSVTIKGVPNTTEVPARLFAKFSGVDEITYSDIVTGNPQLGK